MSENIHHLSGNLLVGSSHFFVDTTNNRVGITTADPDAGLHVNSNAYVHTDFRVGSDIAMNVTSGRITAGSFEGDGSLLENVPGDSGSWVNGSSSNVHLAVSTDYVGIGTDSPAHKLDVDGDINISSGSTLRVDGTPAVFSNWTVHTNGSDIYRSSGNVGIGVTSPGYQLDLQNISKAMMRIKSNATSGDGDAILYIDSSQTGESDIDFMHDGVLNWRLRTGDASGTNFQIHNQNDACAFAIKQDGNVGIGHTNPGSSLHVNLGHAAGQQHIRATQTSLANSTAGIRFGDGNWDAFIDHSHGNKDLMNFGFYRNPTRQVEMVLTHEGRVGIGNTTPIALLDIKNGRSGTSPNHNMAFYVTTDIGGNGPGPEIRHTNQSQGIGFGYCSIYATGYNSNQPINIISRGSDNVFIKNYAAYSDDRIKTNEEYITNATETLMKLKPQIYDKHEKINEICDDPTREAGLIAQDVYYDAPELRYLVSARNDGIGDEPVNIPEEKPFVDDDPTKDPDYSGWGNASAGLAYIQLVPYLIKAVQEIHQTHQTTKTELKADLSETKTELKADLQTTKDDLQTTRTELADLKERLNTHTHPLEEHTHPLEPHTHPLEEHTHPEIAIEKAKTRELQQRLTLIEHSHAALVARLEALENI